MFSSKYTTWLGIAVEIITLLERFSAEKPIPSTPEEWYRFTLQVMVGIGLILAKDFNKTNAAQANPTSQTAPTVSNTTMVEPTLTPKGES